MYGTSSGFSLKGCSICSKLQFPRHPSQWRQNKGYYDRFGDAIFENSISSNFTCPKLPQKITCYCLSAHSLSGLILRLIAFLTTESTPLRVSCGIIVITWTLTAGERVKAPFSTLNHFYIPCNCLILTILVRCFKKLALHLFPARDLPWKSISI